MAQSSYTVMWKKFWKTPILYSALCIIIPHAFERLLPVDTNKKNIDSFLRVLIPECCSVQLHKAKIYSKLST